MESNKRRCIYTYIHSVNCVLSSKKDALSVFSFRFTPRETLFKKKQGEIDRNYKKCEDCIQQFNEGKLVVQSGCDATLETEVIMSQMKAVKVILLVLVGIVKPSHVLGNFYFEYIVNLYITILLYYFFYI